MAIPLALPIALSAMSSIPNWMAAFNQNKQADQLRSELQRPDFEIPESANRALQSAETQAGMTRLPGQSAIEGRLDQATANQVDMVERMGIGGPTSINAASQAYGMQMGKENELGIAAASNWNQNQATLRDQLGRMSEWEFKKWNWDKRLPYENKADAIRALTEGAMRNADAGAKDLFGGAANIALSAYMTDKNNDFLSGLFGNKTTAPTEQGAGMLGSASEFFEPDITRNQNNPSVMNQFPRPNNGNPNDAGMPWNAGGKSPFLMESAWGERSPVDLRPVMSRIANPFG
jgi:hypothetical protein